MYELSSRDSVNERNTRGGVKKWVPGTVIRRLGPLTYLLKVGRQLHYVHVDHLLRTERENSEEVLDEEGFDDVFPRNKLFQCCLQSWHLARQHLQVLLLVGRSQKHSHPVRYLYRHRNQLQYKPQCSRTRPQLCLSTTVNCKVPDSDPHCSKEVSLQASVAKPGSST